MAKTKRRPNGDGMVRKRPDGTWEGRIVVGHRKDGMPIYKSVFAKTQKALLPKLHRTIEQHRNANLTEESAMFLDDWLERWLEDYVSPTVRKSTAERYRTSLAPIRRILGDKPIRLITPADIQKLYNTLLANGRKKATKDGDTGLSPNTVRGIHAVLHQAMKAAVGARLIPSNPTEGATLPKAVRKPLNVFNREQQGRFMEAIEAEPLWKDFFYTECTTGLRKGEICGLRWEDFDENAGTLWIRHTLKENGGGEFEISDPKTDRGMRTILLPASTLHLLMQRKKQAVSEWIFPSLRDPEKPVSPSAAYDCLKKILRRAGLPNLRFHDLRHGFSTNAIAAGVDPKSLAQILGHANASFTLDVYGHVTTDMQRNAATIVGDFMEDLFGKELKPWEENGNQEKDPSA